MVKPPPSCTAAKSFGTISQESRQNYADYALPVSLGGRCEKAVNCARGPVRNALLDREHPATANDRPARRRNENEPLLQRFLIFDLNHGKSAEPPERLFETRGVAQGHVQKEHDCRRHVSRQILENLHQCPLAARRTANNNQVRDAPRARLSLAVESFS